jgi:cell division protein ZapA
MNNKDQGHDHEKTRVTVDIYGEEYVIKGYASPEYIKGIAAYVDKKMRLIAQRNPQLPVTKIAVLAALNIADELSKLQEDYDSLVKLLEEEKAIK